jgi:hypothetical protein
MAVSVKMVRPLSFCPSCSAPVNRLTSSDAQATTFVAGPLGGIVEIPIPISIIYACTACEWAVVR